MSRMRLNTIASLLSYLISLSSAANFGFGCGKTKWAAPYMLYAACWSDSEKRWGSSTLDLNLCYEFANDNIRPASNGSAFKTVTDCDVDGSTLSCNWPLGSKSYLNLELNDEISNDDGVLKCGDNAGSWGDGSVLDGMDGLLF